MNKARARDGITVELIELDMTGSSAGPILGPSHPGRWLLVKAASGRILAWLDADDEDTPRELYERTGARKWLEVT